MYDRVCNENAKSTKELLELYIKNILIKKYNKNDDIYSKWNEIIPNKLSQHLEIKEIKDDKIILIADHPAWAQKAKLSKNNILQNINKTFPSTNIKTIHIICR